jgi:curved DNA-binding protein CbpA
LTERDPYAVLGVPVHAGPDAIAAAYRDKARRHHPDVSADPEAERRMAEINAAWATLRDPDRRAAWDRANLRVQQAPGPAPFDPLAPVRPARPVPRRPAAAPMSPFGPAARPAASPAGAPVPSWRLGPNGEGAAGPPPGPRRGSVLGFGRHIGWSLGEIARVDPGYLAWLRERREGAPYRAEIDALLASMREAANPQSPPSATDRRRRGLFG